MPLFQEAIIKKHLSAIDDTIIESAYSEYQRVYSPEKIKNIKVAKEEQYQEGFIKDVFGAVLGYSVYPESPFNIETERKNETNSKKADGAILKDEKVVGVIELKDNKTKNLDSVKDQAFGYKNNHKECSYVISSNFHKLRFYIDDATEYEEFDLYNLDKETFKRLLGQAFFFAKYVKPYRTEVQHEYEHLKLVCNMLWHLVAVSFIINLPVGMQMLL